MKVGCERVMGKQESISIWSDQRGVTLLELIIAGVIAVGVVAAGFTILTSTEKATTTNGQVVETQQNVRIAMDMLSRDVKQAGFGMIAPVGNCPTAIVPGDNTPAGPDTGPDQISLVVPVGNAVGIAAGNPLGLAAVPPWTLLNPVFPGFNQLQLEGTGNAVAAMTVEAGGNLVGSSVTLAGIATTQVTGAGASVLNVNPVETSAQFGANTPVYLLQCITYQVIPPPDPNNLCDGRSPCLVRGVATGGLNCNTANSRCLPIADEIEDIQFSYACDGCMIGINGGIPDDVIDDQPGSAAGYDPLDFVSNNSWSIAPMIPNTIRMVQATVVGRQRVADQGVGETNSQTIQSSQVLQVSDHNHAAGVFVAGDFAALNPAYNSVRHRLFTRTVELRNPGR